MLELISEHACFGGVQRYYRHQSSADRPADAVWVFLPAAGSRWQRARTVLPGGADLQRGNLRHQGRRAAAGCRAGPDADYPRHQPARRERAG